jgi:phage gp46-like protein
VATCATTAPKSRYRPFFTYHPNGGGSTPDACGNTDCGVPGFGLVKHADGTFTIDTSQRAVSIALLIMMTRAVSSQAACGTNPKIASGYWGDSFRSDNFKSGTNIYDIPVNATMSQTVALIKAYAAKDLQKLVAYNEADSVTVDAKYVGSGKITLTINIMIDGNSTTLPLTASGNGTQWTVS